MSQVELTRALHAGNYARATSAATWSEETVGVVEQTFMLWRELGRKRTVETSLSFFGHVDAASLMDNYRANCTYRWNAFRPWLFFSITPQIAFPRERDYALTPLLRLHGNHLRRFLTDQASGLRGWRALPAGVFLRFVVLAPGMPRGGCRNAV